MYSETKNTAAPMSAPTIENGTIPRAKTTMRRHDRERQERRYFRDGRTLGSSNVLNHVQQSLAIEIADVPALALEELALLQLRDRARGNLFHRAGRSGDLRLREVGQRRARRD